MQSAVVPRSAERRVTRRALSDAFSQQMGLSLCCGGGTFGLRRMQTGSREWQAKPARDLRGDGGPERMPRDALRDACSKLRTNQGLGAAQGRKHSRATKGVGPVPATGPSPVTPVARGEIRLVERARSGDAEAFDALVALRLLPTFRLARAILGSTEEAEDATQEAFIAAWRGLHSLREPERFDAWFGRIVVNACRMSMRRRPRPIVVSLESVTPRQSAEADDPWTSGVIDSDALNRAIDGLPLQQRAILALYYLEDRPMSSVAMILGIPSGTAKWRLFRARTALRTAMAAGDGRASAFAPQDRERLRPAEAPVPLSGDSA